jgi:hypothetical protein
LSGGFIRVTPDLHPHDLKIWKDMDMRDRNWKRCKTPQHRVYSVNPGDSGKKSGDSEQSGESGLGFSGVSEFHSHGNLEILPTRVYRAYSNYSLREYRKETRKEIDRGWSSWDTLRKRGGEASSLQI